MHLRNILIPNKDSLCNFFTIVKYFLLYIMHVYVTYVLHSKSMQSKQTWLLIPVHKMTSKMKQTPIQVYETIENDHR